MINVKIGHMEYHIHESTPSSYYPCTDHSKPDVLPEELLITETSGKLNRYGYCSADALVKVLAKRIQQLEAELANVKP